MTHFTDEMIAELVKALVRIDDEKVCEKFLNDLCTRKEL